MYDNAGQDNGQSIDEKLYLGGTQMDSLLLQTTSGRITLEIVGLSDYTEFAQASISKYEDGLKQENVKYFYSKKKEELPTGTCLILVTSDSERTMCTFL